MAKTRTLSVSNILANLVMDKALLLSQIDDWRIANKFTQQEVADKLGIKQEYYSRIIKNPESVSFDKIKEMYDDLGLDFSQMITPSTKLSDADINSVIETLEAQNKNNNRLIEMLKRKLHGKDD